MPTEAEHRALLAALEAPELDEPLTSDAPARPEPDPRGPEAEADGPPAADGAPPARAAHLLPPPTDAIGAAATRPPTGRGRAPTRPAAEGPDLRAAAEVFGDHSSANPRRWSGEAPEAEPAPRPGRRREAEGQHRLGVVIDALVLHLVENGELDLRPGALPAAVSARLTASLRVAGGFTQFGRTAAAILMADPDVDELYIDDQALTRRLSALG